VTLLDDVAAVLRAARVDSALIGAAALAVHGVSRSTADQDLLVTDPQVLEAPFWAGLAASARCDIRRGDADDPLAGVVRITRENERDVDVIVGRHAWQRETIDRAVPFGESGIRVVTTADLVLLKLFAGGSQDRWDIEQLLALDTGTATREDVERRLSALPARCREVWARVREER
jgi:hypothetical protein